jgi:Methyltransferase domain
VSRKTAPLLPRAVSRVSMPVASIFDRLGNARWYNYPLGRSATGTREAYLRLAAEARAQSFPVMDEFERRMGFALDAAWMHELALHTQVAVKRSAICYQHGRLLYAVVRDYARRSGAPALHLLETGTARGFSSLCMARALEDAGAHGTIVSFDVLPHTVPMYWNCVDDLDGPRTRARLLAPWNALVERYVLFHQGDTLREMPKLHQSRIHVAYLDGQHTYQHVLEEFGHVTERQRPGDIACFDDYSEADFPGVVKAVDDLCDRWGYAKEVVRVSPERAYVVATKR